MKKLKRFFDLVPALILWLMLSVFLWGWIFTFLTDTKPENKLSLFVDATVTDGTGLAVKLEETLLDDTIRMVKVHPFTYAMLDSEPLRQADVYLVRASHVEEYREWFAPLPERFADAMRVGEDSLFVLDDTVYGIRIWNGQEGTGIAQSYIDYHDPTLPDEDYYLIFGRESLHLTGNENGLDDQAVLLAETLLFIH